jgi:hypothetical protein
MRFQRALRLRIKGANAVDFIVQQIDPVGFAAAHRIEIQQRTAHGKLAVFHHL